MGPRIGGRCSLPRLSRVGPTPEATVDEPTAHPQAGSGFPNGSGCTGGRSGPTIAVPFKGKRLSANQRAVNRSIAKARALGERAAATVKTWRILTKLRCCPHRHPDPGRDHRASARRRRSTTITMRNVQG